MQPVARGLLAVDRDRVLEVAEQDVGLRRDVGGLGHHLLVGEVQEVDHPRGPQRDLGQRGGRSDGQRLEEVAGVAHGRDDIDSPVNCAVVSLWHAPSPARRARRRSPVPAAAQAHRVRLRRAGPVRRRRRPGALRRAPRAAAGAAASRSPAPPASTTWRRAAAPPAQARASSRSWPSSTAARRARRRSIWPRSCSATRPSRAMRAPDGHPGDERARRGPGQRPGGVRPGAADGQRPALRPAHRRAAAGLRRALDHRPGARRRLRAPGRPPPSARPSRPPALPAAVAQAAPCPPCPPLPPRPAEDRLPGPDTGGLPRRRRD